MILDPLPVDRNVAFEEVEARSAEQVFDVASAKVHSVDLVTGAQELFGEVTADESIDAEDQD